MKNQKIEFVVYDMNNIACMVTTEKMQAITKANSINGKVCKRITTIEECEALNADCTVWA
jgi:Holliday junction resolvasome RuvABC DNA-binding subunit